MIRYALICNETLVDLEFFFYSQDEMIRIISSLSSRMFFLLLIFAFGNISSKIPKPEDNDTPWATMGKLYRIGRFYSGYGNGADSKKLERMDRQINDVKENFVHLMEDVRDIKETIQIYHGPQNLKVNPPNCQSSGSFVE